MHIYHHERHETTHRATGGAVPLPSIPSHIAYPAQAVSARARPRHGMSRRRSFILNNTARPGETNQRAAMALVASPLSRSTAMMRSPYVHAMSISISPTISLGLHQHSKPRKSSPLPFSAPLVAPICATPRQDEVLLQPARRRHLARHLRLRTKPGCRGDHPARHGGRRTARIRVANHCSDVHVSDRACRLQHRCSLFLLIQRSRWKDLVRRPQHR